MKNKIIALLLAVCLCVVFCACGSSANSDEQAPAQVNPVGVNETLNNETKSEAAPVGAESEGQKVAPYKVEGKKSEVVNTSAE